MMRTLGWIVAGILGVFLTTIVWANPQGGTVAAGRATIRADGKELNVHQQTDRAVLNWRRFGIDVDEHTRFHQPRAESVALNRVTGPDVSRILGRLSANGRIFLVNPNGIVFGPHSRVDVNGLVATTSDIPDADFMAGRYDFSIAGKPDAGIVHQGTITAAEGGMVALVAPWVRNEGVIQARLGKVALAGGAETFTLDLYGDELVRIGVPAEMGDRLAVANQGTVQADGGTAWITADAAGRALDAVVNLEGIVRANRVEERDGAVYLTGAKIQVDGRIEAEGGTVEVRGRDVLVTEGATVASKDGDVLLYGERAAVLNGDVDAPGGQVELSSPGFVGWSGEVIADHFLIDPTNVEIVTGAGDTTDLTKVDELADADLDGAAQKTHLGVAAINSAKSDVTVMASNDIDQSAPIDITWADVGLTLDAGNQVRVHEQIWTNGGHVTLKAGDKVLFDQNASEVKTQGGGFKVEGDLQLDRGTKIDTQGGDITFDGDVSGDGQSLNLVAAKLNFADLDNPIALGDILFAGDALIGDLTVQGARHFTNQGTMEFNGSDFDINLLYGTADVGDSSFLGFLFGLLSGHGNVAEFLGFLTGKDLSMYDLSKVGIRVNLSGDLTIMDSNGKVIGTVKGDVKGNSDDIYDDDGGGGDTGNGGDDGNGGSNGSGQESGEEETEWYDWDDDWGPDDPGGQDDDQGGDDDGDDDEEEGDPAGGEKERKMLEASIRLLMSHLGFLDPDRVAMIKKQLEGIEDVKEMLGKQAIALYRWQQANWGLHDELKEKNNELLKASTKDLALGLLKNAKKVKDLAGNIKDPAKRKAVQAFLDKPNVKKALEGVEQGGEAARQADTIAKALEGDMGTLEGLGELGKQIPVLGDLVGMMQHYAEIGEIVAGIGEFTMTQSAIDEAKAQLERQENNLAAREEEWNRDKQSLDSVAYFAKTVSDLLQYSDDAAQTAEAQRLLNEAVNVLEQSGYQDKQDLAASIRDKHGLQGRG